ncbi:DUF2961 domain-containing protein [Oleiharenicola lentus]|uniref:DUF2961 domain-containing protein n=1 Tax=Oleiharenicola lentus TaxID=2508720 RepID=UPI003F679796
MSLSFRFIAATFVTGLLAISAVATAPTGAFALNLPSDPVPDRISLKRNIAANATETYADLDGPGCIRHIWITLKRPGRTPMINRQLIIRIYFDDATVPNVEAPVGDFFGVMHGVDFYEINTEFISVKPYSGYNAYFQMPFAKKARIEFVNGPENSSIYLQVDWHRYPGKKMEEERRFSAAWRREMPTQRYGSGFQMLDADGPGDLIGFFYGVRLIDNVDRWSHGGAENIYIDGKGAEPAFVRGIGGEDTFGTSYGGVIHPPETHLHAGMPYYTYEDTGEARGAQRIVGYRFFAADPIAFKESIHMRFGTMENDICAMVYWYQKGAPRPFVKMPGWKKILPAVELPAGSVDLPLPENGAWRIGPLHDNKGGVAINSALEKKPAADRSTELKEWKTQRTMHGFVDFGYIHRPEVKGVGTHHSGKAAEAVAIVDAPQAGVAKVRLAWDDQLILRVNDEAPVDLGTNAHFRSRTVEVPVKQGRNLISVTLSNTTGTNHGGWAFAFRAEMADGALLVPQPVQ